MIQAVTARKAAETVPGSVPVAHPRGDERWFARASAWVPALLFCAAALAMCYAYLGTDVAAGNRGLTNLTESYGALERVALWQGALQWLPGANGTGGFFTLAPWAIAWTSRLAFAAMFMAQAWAFWLAWRGTGPGWVGWLIGPAIGHVIMLLLVPSNADLFFYAMTGDLAANGFNPYQHPLMAFPDHPLLPLNHWIEMTAVYGPLWTAANAAIMGLTGPDAVAATLAYKLVLGAVALALAVLVHRFTRHVTGNERLATAAMVLVAWQPNMLVETSGQAHNDPLMLLLSTGGIFLAIAGGPGAVRGGLVLITLSTLIKYVTLPLLGLLGLVRLVQRREGSGWKGVFTSWLVDGLAILAVMVAAFAPFWAGFGTLTEMFLEPGRLYTNPIWFDAYMLLDWLFPHRVARTFATITRPALQLIAIGVIVWAIARFLRQVWPLRAKDEPAPELPAWTGPLLSAWTVILTVLALLPVNSHPWYWTWPVVPIAVLTAWNARDGGTDAHRTLPRWLWGYVALTALMTLAYHTRIVHL
jgi:hypothetical protein